MKSEAETEGQTLKNLKKCEKILTEEFGKRKSQTINRLLGLTFNNLGVFYKKTNKPKVSLGYLKKALQLEVSSLGDNAAVGSTHLNIAALLSTMGQYPLHHPQFPSSPFIICAKFPLSFTCFIEVETHSTFDGYLEFSW